MKKIVMFFCSFIFLLVSKIQGDLPQNPFVIIIPSYNNKSFYEQNLGSVFSQEYQNYRVIYIDDCSTDGTGNRVKQFVKLHNQEHRFTLIKNRHRHKHMANHFNAAHRCKDHEIIVHLDGDDWFSHSYVLQTLNSVYQDPNIWLTYGQFMHFPALTLGGCKPYPQDYIDRRDFRYYEHIAGHPRTFRAALFKHIKLKDFLYQGSFVPCCADVAMMVPMLEMCGGEHIFCISEVLTYYNMHNPLNIFKTPGYYTSLLHIIESALRSKERGKYPLLSHYHAPDFSPESVAVIIFANDKIAADKAVASLERYTSGFSSLYIVTQNTVEFDGKLQATQKAGINYKIVTAEFNSALKKTLEQLHENFIFIINAENCTLYKYALDTIVPQIKKTYALGFFDSVHRRLFSTANIPFIDLTDGSMGWQLGYGTAILPYEFTINGALYTRLFVTECIANLTNNNKAIKNKKELAQCLASALKNGEVALGRN